MYIDCSLSMSQDFFWRDRKASDLLPKDEVREFVDIQIWEAVKIMESG